MKLKSDNHARDYVSPQIIPLDISSEGVLCVSGNLLEGFQNGDELEFN